MNRLYKRDIGWGIFFLVLAIFVWVVVPYQIKDSGRTHMGPRFFPRVISLIMGTMSVGLIVSNLFKHLKDVKSGKAVKHERSRISRNTMIVEGRAIVIFLLMMVYAVLMPIIGFIFSSIVICALILIILGAVKWYYYIIMLAAILIIYYLFKYQLYVQLP